MRYVYIFCIGVFLVIVWQFRSGKIRLKFILGGGCKGGKLGIYLRNMQEFKLVWFW